VSGSLPLYLDPAVDAYLLSHHSADDVYLLERQNGVSYWIPRLINNNLTWRYVGATHEHLVAVDGPYKTRRLHTMKIIDHGDGGSKGDKYNRDRALLEAETLSDPENARSWFYLGQTYLGLELYSQAIEAFRRRVELKGVDEETYYAQYQLGNALNLTEQPKEALVAWLKAWNMRPKRREALYEVVKQMRRQELYLPAYALATAVSTLPPADDVLFVNKDVEDFLLPFERSICAYYVEGAKAALDQTLALLVNPDLPEYIREVAIKNWELYRRWIALNDKGNA
jgi:tetratricopeptide (TPR) repeat protein